tara:strand:- start:2692 stop:3738 length:1047 start_codon:yes stop_codon:yes gene_type:complete
MIIRWEGSVLGFNSLAHVNRQMIKSLVELGVDVTTPSFSLEEPSVIVRHQWPPDFSPVPGKKLVLMQPWEYGSLPQAWIEPILSHVDQVWAYTQYVKDVYVSSGIPEEMVKIMPLGVDPERFRPGAEPAQLDGAGFNFLFVGGTIARKGIDILINAYCQAFSRADDVCLVIKDQGTRSFYRHQTNGELIQGLMSDPTAPRILYTDQEMGDDEMPGLYAACQCLVHPYRGEGFGLTVAEAMAAGVVVIVTKGGATDDFCNYQNAVLVESHRKLIDFPEPTVEPTWILEASTLGLAKYMRQVWINNAMATGRSRLHDPMTRSLAMQAWTDIRAGWTWKHSAIRAKELLSD